MKKASLTRGRPRSFDREAALAQMTELFWRQGYDATSVADLTESIGVNTPSLYAAFGNKEKAYCEAVDYYRHNEGQRVWENVEAQTSARDAVATMLQTSAEEFTRSNKPRGCMVVLGALSMADSNAAIVKRMKGYRAEARAKLVAKIQSGIENGELPDTADAESIAGFYDSVQLGMAVRARDGASRQELKQTAELALRSWEMVTSHQG
ncbi:MAG: TetR/AcrR family transcriptional regulator [Marinobacter adhaerens]|uniref:TetR/AcrR family transcriptional regulator n=1 Tax=Marinobacter adhaerens TaxID=1033846 RepID=A0A844I799_9GAMM|nr:TetR/AcrR family transcriptional regulator [Marinobacter adhaerens]